MEICHFFVIFYDFVMKCVYKSTIYTFVIRDKIWTPPLCCTKVYMLLLCFGSRKHPPTPYMSGTFVLAPPPPLETLRTPKSRTPQSLFTYFSLYVVSTRNNHLFLSARADDTPYIKFRVNIWNNCIKLIARSETLTSLKYRNLKKTSKVLNSTQI